MGGAVSAKNCPDYIGKRINEIAKKRGCEGLNYVIVSGNIVIENAVNNGLRVEKVLQKLVNNNLIGFNTLIKNF